MTEAPSTPVSPETPESSEAIEPTSLPDIPFRRTIKSFVKRAGRTTLGQAKAFELYSQQFVLPYQTQPLDFQATFGRSAPLVLEIGFGMGDATAHIAGLLPNTDFIGCEVHEPGVGALLKLIGERSLSNLRILQHDAVEVIDHMLPENSLDGVHIFFPDPWHKTRHNKRRLIQSPLVAKLAARLKPGGYLHCATDWAPYAQQILQVLRAEPKLKNSQSETLETLETLEKPESGVGLGGFAPKPDYRPLTKFEKRGLRLGHGVWDLVFIRT